MKRRHIAEIVWLAVIGLLIFGSLQGGDASVACWLYFTILTFPFFLLWEQYGYDVVSNFLSKDFANGIGVVLAIALSLIVWWHLVPYLFRVARARSRTQSPKSASDS